MSNERDNGTEHVMVPYVEHEPEDKLSWEWFVWSTAATATDGDKLYEEYSQYYTNETGAPAPRVQTYVSYPKEEQREPEDKLSWEWYKWRMRLTSSMTIDKLYEQYAIYYKRETGMNVPEKTIQELYN